MRGKEQDMPYANMVVLSCNRRLLYQVIGIWIYSWF